MRISVKVQKIPCLKPASSGNLFAGNSVNSNFRKNGAVEE